jgi:hypothetical protein
VTPGTLSAMRRLLAPLMTLAALATPALLAAGCGSDDLPSVSAAEAAQSTRDAHTARTTFRMEMRGMGLPQPMAVTAEGVSATDGARMDMTFDFGPILQGIGGGDDGRVRFLLDGRRAWADPPEVEGLDIPGGATWVTVDLKKAVEALGVDPEGFGELFRLSPQQQLAALESAGSVKKVGEEEVDGVRTTHLRGTVTLRDYARALPAERRRQLDKAIRQLAEVAGEDPEWLDEPTPTEMWVDADAHIRRMIQKSEIPAQPGIPAGSIQMTTEFDDFGTPLELDPPEGDDVFDATDLVARQLREAR